MADSSLYELLELTPNATLDDVKSAYRRLAPQVHPDQGGTRALFRLVHEAYETLTNDLLGATSLRPGPTDVPLGHMVPALGGNSALARDERAKWVKALLAQERASSPRICVSA